MNIDQLIGRSELPARKFIDEAFPNITDLARLAREQVTSAESWSAFDGPAPTVIGTAFDYRLRYSFAITPFNGLVAHGGAIGVLRDVLGLTPVINLDRSKPGDRDLIADSEIPTANPLASLTSSRPSRRRSTLGSLPSIRLADSLRSPMSERSLVFACSWACSNRFLGPERYIQDRR